MNGPLTEQFLIDALVRGISRSPLQRNGLHSADAELVSLPGLHGSALAITTDAIAEEIDSGLYADPALAGWMAVMANLSDLAAVGAEPLGMLIAQTLPKSMAEKDIASLHDGIRHALAACSTYLLGGDTNISDRLILTGTALGLVPTALPLSRLGCRPGDLLYTSGQLGSGNAFAVALLSGIPVPPFRPTARLREGKALRGIASACMDTSDGVLATLDQLARLNGVGFCFAEGWEEVLAADARTAMQQLSLPAWLLLAGCHGEFELLFTVPPEQEAALRLAAAEINWQPLPLGVATADITVTAPLYGDAVALDTAKIRSFWDEAGGDVYAYLGALLAMDASLQENGCSIEQTPL